MTRIKEYMELLTSEIEAFRSDVNRLETINERIKDLKVSIDLKELKAALMEHNNQLEKQREYQERFYTRMETLFQKAGVYPKWAIIVFIVAILISVASLLYAYRTKTALEKLKDVHHTEQVSVFKSGKASSINEYKSPK
jgi:hypothetical protein